MIFMARTFDPMGNRVTSYVFFTLVDGPKCPNDLVKVFKTKHQTVSDHLYRLVSIGIVRRGRKEGKRQYYEIDWDRFSSTFLEEAARQAVAIGEWGTLKEIAGMLEKNRCAKEMAVSFIRSYFEFAFTDDGRFLPDVFFDLSDDTLLGLAAFFGDSLPDVYDEIRNIKAPGKDEAEFIGILKRWKEIVIPSCTTKEIALKEVVKSFKNRKV